jgi:hypothetical protein
VLRDPFQSRLTLLKNGVFTPLLQPLAYCNSHDLGNAVPSRRAISAISGAAPVL